MPGSRYGLNNPATAVEDVDGVTVAQGGIEPPTLRFSDGPRALRRTTLNCVELRKECRIRPSRAKFH
jgi:hypothetical protein